MGWRLTLDFFPFLGLTSSSGHSSSPATWKVGSSETGAAAAEASRSSSSSTATFLPFFLSFFLPDFLIAPYETQKASIRVRFTSSESQRSSKSVLRTINPPPPPPPPSSSSSPPASSAARAANPEALPPLVFLEAGWSSSDSSFSGAGVEGIEVDLDALLEETKEGREGVSSFTFSFVRSFSLFPSRLL